jgi:hypothetical protein
MMPSQSNEKHFFKFADLEEVWITSNSYMPNHHYRLIIKDKSGTINSFPNCRINCNDLINIYYALKAYIKHTNPNCKTRFVIEDSYAKELAKNSEWNLNQQKRSELAKTHNENHIPQNIFELKCEFCSHNKSNYYCSPVTFSNLLNQYKNWIVVKNNENRNSYTFTVVDNSKYITESAIWGNPWSNISTITYRLDGEPFLCRDEKNTGMKKMQKYILRITNRQGRFIENNIFFIVENDRMKIFSKQVNEYLNKFKTRPVVTLDNYDNRF